jgi:hypothetical protein
MGFNAMTPPDRVRGDSAKVENVVVHATGISNPK